MRPISDLVDHLPVWKCTLCELFSACLHFGGLGVFTVQYALWNCTLCGSRVPKTLVDCVNTLGSTRCGSTLWGSRVSRDRVEIWMSTYPSWGLPRGSGSPHSRVYTLGSTLLVSRVASMRLSFSLGCGPTQTPCSAMLMIVAASTSH